MKVEGLQLVLKNELEALAERQAAVKVELVGVGQLVAEVGVAVADRLERPLVQVVLDDFGPRRLRQIDPHDRRQLLLRVPLRPHEGQRQRLVDGGRRDENVARRAVVGALAEERLDEVHAAEGGVQ